MRLVLLAQFFDHFREDASGLGSLFLDEFLDRDV